ncbi:MAG: HU family DNA-binding protein [Acetobacteraceae bacterium]
MSNHLHLDRSLPRATEWMDGSDPADRVASEHGFDKGEARRVAKTTLAAIAAAASAGEEVNLTGFGKF